MHNKLPFDDRLSWGYFSTRGREVLLPGFGEPCWAIGAFCREAAGSSSIRENVMRGTNLHLEDVDGTTSQ